MHSGSYTFLHMYIHSQNKKMRKVCGIFKIKPSTLIKNFPHIWGNSEGIRCKVIGRPSSQMTLHPIHSEFPLIRGKFFFLFTSVYSNQWPRSGLKTNPLKNGYNRLSNLSNMSNLNECCFMCKEEKCLTADLNSSQSTEAESEIRVSLLLGLTK